MSLSDSIAGRKFCLDRDEVDGNMNLRVERVSVSIHKSFDSERLLTMLGLVVWSGEVSIFVITFLPCLRQTSKQSQPWQLSSITNAIKF
jgi:hypothetical protein